jgi:glycosyltransferase involved in cell wall biosynthesis
MAPRITILLPTHNRPDVLAFAVRSVLWQTEADFELLIVGDGCSDATRRVVAGFADQRIRFFDLPKAPLSGYANRNIALRQARGRFVAYAQDDDLWFPDHLARLVSAMEAMDAAWSYSRPLWCTADGLLLPFAIDLGLADELQHFMTKANHIPSCCVMHSRAMLERVQYWPEDVARAGDWICWRRMIATADRPPLYCPTVTAIHFRAAWKRSDLPEVERLAEIARGAVWWPADGRLAIPDGTSEQAVFFDALTTDPVERPDRIRSAVAAILDRLAWGAACRWADDLSRQWNYDVLRSRYDALKSDHEALRSDHDALRRRWTSRSKLLRQLGSTLLRKTKRRSGR